MTKEVYEEIVQYKDLISNTVRSRACSAIPTRLMELIPEVLKGTGYTFCRSCNSGLLRAFSRTLDEIVKYEKKSRKYANSKTTRQSETVSNA